MSANWGPVEAADRGRPDETFPKHWGIPPGTPGSEERAAWVLANVQRAVLSRSSRAPWQLDVTRPTTPADCRQQLALKKPTPWSPWLGRS